MRQTAGADMVSAKLKARKTRSGMIMLHVGRSAFAAASERGSPRKTPPTAFVNAPAAKPPTSASTMTDAKDMAKRAPEPLAIPLKAAI